MIFEVHPLTERINQIWRSSIIKEFPELDIDNNANYLSFKEFLSDSPQSFYTRNLTSKYYQFIEKLFIEEPKRFKLIYLENYPEFNLAFKYLDQINSLSFHDTKLPSDTIDLLRSVDSNPRPLQSFLPKTYMFHKSPNNCNSFPFYISLSVLRSYRIPNHLHLSSLNTYLHLHNPSSNPTP